MELHIAAAATRMLPRGNASSQVGVPAVRKRDLPIRERKVADLGIRHHAEEEVSARRKPVDWRVPTPPA